MYETIVVGTDGSETGRRAVERAAILALRLPARVVIVTAHEPGAPWPRRSDRARLRRDEDEVELVLSEARAVCTEAGVTEVETRPVVGDPAVALVDVATESDASLIVVGNVGVSGGMRFLLGSVPNRVLHRAPCDVLVARTRTTW